jgi:hypothetical protein
MKSATLGPLPAAPLSLSPDWDCKYYTMHPELHTQLVTCRSQYTNSFFEIRLRLQVTSSNDFQQFLTYFLLFTSIF